MGAYTCQYGTVHKVCRCPQPHSMPCPTPDACKTKQPCGWRHGEDGVPCELPVGHASPHHVPPRTLDVRKLADAVLHAFRVAGVREWSRYGLFLGVDAYDELLVNARPNDLDWTDPTQLRWRGLTITRSEHLDPDEVQLRHVLSVPL